MTQTPDRGTQPPNILLICTDQQRYEALGAYGSPHVQTPNLDRLAGQGVLFESCYVQSTVCAPSRATLMTSRYVSNHGLWANGVDLHPSTRLFTRELADAGYDCGLVGKLHLGSCFAGRSEPRVDDGLRVFRWAHDPYRGSSENAYHRWLQAAHPDLYAAALSGEGEHDWDTMPTEAHYSHWIAEETIDFLRSSRRDGQPFCFIANFFDPHHGFGAPKEYLDRYADVDLPDPVTVPGELEGKPPVFTEASRRSYAGHAKGYQEYSEAELAEARRAYYAMVTLVDDEVGRILDALEAEGLAENTLVVFTSDHGEMLGDHQLMLKGPMVYDVAVRVPLLLRWPGVLPAGERRSELVQWVDLAPTLLEAAGVAAPRDYQGESLLPLAAGQPDAWSRDWALCQYRDSGHGYDPPVHVTMLRSGSHKLAVHHGRPTSNRDGSGELYDLAADPDELHNLWDDEAAAATRHRLTALLLDVLVAVEDRSSPRLAHW
ncbi:sulfatase-like hydrolase/transferase [Auraticoccus sp. F435]|uniref:Sulfatase-like hydrolase/transferase n=1 Tax=Auraticoccus cholistanensis TaxID=2656650 RepID=A0A6A9UZY0_9ACTN|nr:sulfatase-like hydrolase/transferase [Auraticoccus cholistanensis]MVA74460.1 sulfatase-like hydrolase/transferase [Auraticoccus cholistanensis]